VLDVQPGIVGEDDVGQAAGRSHPKVGPGLARLAHAAVSEMVQPIEQGDAESKGTPDPRRDATVHQREAEQWQEQRRSIANHRSSRRG
jgi:hypothetical protein